MDNSSVLIPEEINKALNERADTWRGLDAARANLDKAESYTAKVGKDINAAPMSPLTNGDSPATEIYAALQQIEREVADINKAEGTIQSYSADIERLKNQIRQRYYIAIGSVAFLALIMFCWIMSLVK